MFEDPVDTLLQQALIDRLDAWELVSHLGLTVEDMLIAFPDEINEHSDMLRELCGLEVDDDCDNDDRLVH